MAWSGAGGFCRCLLVAVFGRLAFGLDRRVAGVFLGEGGAVGADDDLVRGLALGD